MARAREPLAERLARSIERSGECWLWTGTRDRDGYGVMTVGRRQVRAHRASFAQACVNPAHLFLGTPADNTADMITKGRKPVMIDADHPNTKITHAQRDVVRSRRRGGERLAQIAADYGVNFRTISGICKGSNSYGTR